MKNTSLKFYLSTIVLFLFLNTLFCQEHMPGGSHEDCLVVNFPPIHTTTHQGGKICLQGANPTVSGNPENGIPPGLDLNRNVCFSNKKGYLKIGLSKEDSVRYYFDIEKFEIGNTDDDSKFNFIIHGPTSPAYGNNNAVRDITFQFQDAGNAKIRSFRGGSYDTFLQFLTTPNGAPDPLVRMQINADGKVLIGGNIYPFNSNPDYNLIVEGGVISTKFKAAIQGSGQWSDHVFYDNYELRPIEEVEKFIQENKHLPGIPSADELVKDGIDIVDMQAKQMEKIEELTLYLIEMKKDIKELKAENEYLKSKLESK